MFTRRMIVALAACALLSSSTAFAGGGNGGSKSDPIISVRNDTATPIAAFIDPDPAKIAVLAAIPVPTQADIEKAGGKLVNPGKLVEFKVKQGTFLLAAGVNPAAPATVNVTTASGGKYRYAYWSNNTFVKY